MRSLSLCGGHAVEACEEAKVLDDFEIVVERKLLRHVADVLANGFRVAAYVEAGDLRAAGGRLEQAAQHADGGGFARAIGPEEAEDFAFGDGEIEMVDGDKIAERLMRLSITTELETTELAGSGMAGLRW